MSLSHRCLILIIFFSHAVVAEDEVIILSAARVSVPEKEVGGSGDGVRG